MLLCIFYLLTCNCMSVIDMPLTPSTRFSESRINLNNWLSEMESEISTLDLPQDSSPEDIRKLLDSGKVSTTLVPH